MRSLILAFATLLTLASPALAANGPPPSTPAFQREATEDFLRRLDNDQLRLLRRAIQSCPTPGMGRAINPERNPCVITSTDKAVADSGDPDLQAFHAALPDTDRYDENRSTAVWRAWLQKP